MSSRVASWLVVAFVTEFLAADRALAQRDLEVGGYVKELFSYTAASPAGYGFDELLHARLNTKWFVSDAFTAGLEARFRAYAGHTVSATPDFAGMIRSVHDFANLDATLWSTAASIGYAEIDRLWIEAMSGPVQITAGRQRIAWGTNLVWNLTDLFNPLNVLDFDYEERPGVDAVRMQCYTSPVTKVELAVKPGSTGRTTTAAAKITANSSGYDVHLLAAANDHRWIGGVAWAGDLWGAGFRGEATLSRINHDLQTAASLDTHIVRAFSAAMSLDYTFPSSLYLHVEGLYNDLGRTSSAAAFHAQSIVLGLRSPARWSVYGEVARDLSPLVRASLFGIVNPTDASLVIVPTLTWSVATNLDATFLTLLFRGDAGTEFGGYGATGYVRVKYSW